jgi:AraC family transcriptional regulator
MSSVSNGFTVRQTHGYLLRPGVEVTASSDNRNWPSYYVSLQNQTPFEGVFGAVDDHFIVLHLDGLTKVHRRVQRGEDSRLIPPGGLFIMPGGMDFGVRIDGALQTLHLYLRRALIEEVAASILLGDPTRIELLPCFGDNDPLIECLMLGVRDALYDENPSATPYVDYLTRAIAARLIKQRSTVARARLHRDVQAKLALGALTRAIDFMQVNLEHSIDLAMIAGATGLSPSHFARQFRTATGKPPHQYLMQLRVERARRLLRYTETSIVEIAFACGFASQEHMTRLFSRSCGTTPAAYRRALRT